VLGSPARIHGDELIYRCAHAERHRNGDAHPSLCINIKKDVFICGPCGVSGTAWQLAAFIAGLDASDKAVVTEWLRKQGLLKGHSQSDKHRKRNLVATYEYRGPEGHPVARKLRFEPGRNGVSKEFSWQRCEKGKWVDGLGSVEPSLYRLPEIKNEPFVILVEGEKDADCGAALGLPTTTSGGCNSWRPSHADILTGKKVVVLADADEPGRKHARRIADSLRGKVESLKVFELPGAKDLALWVEGGGSKDALLELIQPQPEWQPQSIDGGELLGDVYKFARRFSVLSEAQSTVIALWVVHTHVIDAADSTPYLAITSAEKQCGKSRLLEVLQTLVAEPWFTGRVTAAVLVRKIDAKGPTLLLDESDAAFGSEKDYAEALRGILNTGHRRGGVASLCVGKGAEIGYKDFSTFSPKAIAGIGKLPDTVADRSIPIRLKRAAPGEIVERFRLRNVMPEAEALRGRIQTWCDSVASILRDARPVLPEQLSDRQQDGAEPLLAIADAAGSGWPENARASVVQLCTDSQNADDSIGVRLLTDIRHVLEARDTEKISSTDLVDALAAIETSPWGEWSHGRPITAPKLARLLRPFGVTPHTIRMGSDTSKGYELADFEDSFRRYLKPPASSSSHSPAPEPSHPSHPNTDAGFCDISKPSQTEDVTLTEREIANTDAECDGVTLSTPIGRMEARSGGHLIEEIL
jgi:hypothetical protein